MQNSGSMWSVMFRSLAGVMAGQRRDLLQGILSSAVPDPQSGQIPIAVVVQAFNLLTEALGDPNLGLHSGERAPVGSFEVFDYAVRACISLGDGLLRACRYYRLINSAGYLGLHVEGARAELVHRSDAEPAQRRQAVEFLFSSIVCRMRQLVSDWPIQSVRFAHEKPADEQGHLRIFGAAVSFGHSDDAIVFSSAELKRTLENSQPALALVLDQYVEDLCAQLLPDFLGQVRLAIGEAIRGRNPSLSVTARQLKISARTLQRKLAELNTSHSDVLDGVRKALSVRYLQNPSLSFGEIGFLLGFQEVASFYRAFRRWHGITPSEYRKSNQVER